MTHSGFCRKPQASAAPQLALRPREAAAAISVSLSTLERLTKAGEIAVVRRGRCRLFELAELRDWLARNRTGGRVACQEVAS